MRIGELAGLAGTTPRAVRHYHHLGLLETPSVVGGRREYGIEHLARLLRIRWLAGGGLSLARTAEMLASDAVGGDRDSVLRDLRSARGAIEAQQRSLAEQLDRVDELIARVEAGESLSPTPTVLARFYDDLETRIRALGGDASALRTERQTTLVLASLGMMPDSVGLFVEGLDAGERQESARLYAGIAELTGLDGEEGEAAAAELAESAYELALRHKKSTLAALDDLPGGPLGRTMWGLSHVLTASGYPHPAQRLFVARLLELMLTDPDFAATIRRSAGEENPAL